MCEELDSTTAPAPTATALPVATGATLYTLDSIPVYCAQTGTYLGTLDDNTIAYYQRIDPSGSLLDTTLCGYTHPSLLAYRAASYIDYWEICPTQFLSFLLGKTCTFTNVPRQTWLWTERLHRLHAALTAAWEDDRIDDELCSRLIAATLCNTILWKSATNTYRIPDDLLLSEPTSPSGLDLTISTLSSYISTMETHRNHCTIADISRAISQTFDFYTTSLLATYGHLMPSRIDGSTTSPTRSAARSNQPTPMQLARTILTPRYFLNVDAALDIDVSCLAHDMRQFNIKWADKIDARQARADSSASILSRLSSSTTPQTDAERAETQARTLSVFALLNKSANSTNSTNSTK